MAILRLIERNNRSRSDRCCVGSADRKGKAVTVRVAQISARIDMRSSAGLTVESAFLTRRVEKCAVINAENKRGDAIFDKRYSHIGAKGRKICSVLESRFDDGDLV